MTESEKQRYAIIGGGMLGMTAALRLAQQGHRVTLFEARDQLGGLADAWKLGDVTWDRHYHVTLLSDSYTRKILKELNLDDDMQWVETRTGFFTDGRLHSMSSSLEFLLFPPLSLWSKFRLGLTIFAGSKIKNWRKLEGMLVGDWLQKWSGKKTFEKIWKPLLRSKLGDNYKKTSAAFIWATIARLYAARRTGLKKEMFGYLPGGYARMLEAFEKHIRDAGVEVRLNQSISSITHRDGQIFIENSNSQNETFDQAVLTVPSRVVPKLLPQMAEGEAAKHTAIEYQGIVCASLLIKHSLADFYVTNITDGNVPFTGVIEMSALVDKSEFGGNALIYLPYYVPADHAAFEWSDDEVLEQSLLGLESMYPEFSRNDLVAFRASRVRSVMAISTLNYSQNLPPKQTSVPGVHVINSAQIVNGTLNVNETIKLAETAIPDLLPSAQNSSHSETAKEAHYV